MYIIIIERIDITKLPALVRYNNIVWLIEGGTLSQQ